MRFGHNMNSCFFSFCFLPTSWPKFRFAIIECIIYLSRYVSLDNNLYSPLKLTTAASTKIGQNKAVDGGSSSKSNIVIINFGPKAKQGEFSDRTVDITQKKFF